MPLPLAVVGSDEAATLMEHLPRDGSADVATKRVSEVDHRFSEVDRRFTDMDRRSSNGGVGCPAAQSRR